LRGEENGFLSPVASPPKLLFGLTSSDEPALPEYDLLRGAEYDFFSPPSSPPKLLLGRSLLLSAELTLPEYGLLRPAGLSPPSLGRPEYGFLGAYAFFSPSVKLLLNSPPSLLPADGLLPAVLLLSPGRSDVLSFLGGLFQSVLSEPDDDFPLAEGDLFGLSSDFFVLFDDLPGALSRPVADFLNAIIFCLALSQREGQSYDFLNNFFIFLLMIRIRV
jgi:hypothetical protein